jgi:hypothetical protein
MQVDPEGQTRHDAPQALLSFIVLAHKPLHMLKPGSHVTLHVVPEQLFMEFVDVLHVAQTRCSTARSFRRSCRR